MCVHRMPLANLSYSTMKPLKLCTCLTVREHKCKNIRVLFLPLLELNSIRYTIPSLRCKLYLVLNNQKLDYIKLNIIYNIKFKFNLEYKIRL